MSNSKNPNSIPFLDLVTPHVEMEQELTDIFRQVLHTAGFIGGPMVEDFEKAFAAFCGTSHSSRSAAAPMPCASPSWPVAYSRVTLW